MLIPGTEPEPEPPKTPKPRAPDPIWDTLCETFGLHPVTKTECTRVGRLVRDLKAKGATPDEIPRRLDRYRREWPDAADTPEALLKHWDRFAEDRKTAASAFRIPDDLREQMDAEDRKAGRM